VTPRRSVAETLLPLPSYSADVVSVSCRPWIEVPTTRSMPSIAYCVRPSQRAGHRARLAARVVLGGDALVRFRRARQTLLHHRTVEPVVGDARDPAVGILALFGEAVARVVGARGELQQRVLSTRALP
jgi:hypothetical protein